MINGKDIVTHTKQKKGNNTAPHLNCNSGPFTIAAALSTCALLVWRVEVPTDCLDDGRMGMRSTISTIRWLIKCTKCFIVCSMLLLINYFSRTHCLKMQYLFQSFGLILLLEVAFEIFWQWNETTSWMMGGPSHEWRKMLFFFFLSICLPRVLIHSIGWWGDRQQHCQKHWWICNKDFFFLNHKDLMPNHPSAVKWWLFLIGVMYFQPQGLQFIYKCISMILSRNVHGREHLLTQQTQTAVNVKAFRQTFPPGVHFLWANQYL